MKAHYTPSELDDLALLDLVVDAECSERQAAEGPYYPDKGITRESLLEYAAKARRSISAHQHGGAHNAVLRSEV